MSADDCLLTLKQYNRYPVAQTYIKYKFDTNRRQIKINVFCFMYTGETSSL